MHLGPPNARSASPCCASSTSTLHPASHNETAFLSIWERDVTRAADAAAFRLRADAAVRDDLAQAARCQLLCLFRSKHPTSPGYVRRVIQNAIRSAVRRECRGLNPGFGQLVELDENIAARTDESSFDTTDILTAWLATLPVRLRHLYELLYLRNLTQRDAARLLGVSQPRVAQLHSALLLEGRIVLMAAIA